MKQLLRNKEVRISLWIFLGITVVFSSAASLLDIRFGILSLLMGSCLTAVFLIHSRKRYERLSQLAGDIDRILHGMDASVPLSQYAEGELCILQNELYKMTVRLREQQSALTCEKNALSDSLADISHQIRTPLTTATLLVQSLRNPELDESLRLQRARELLSLLSRIDWLIVTLLKISKLDAGSIQFVPESISLQTLLKQAAEPLQIPIELHKQALHIEAAGSFRGDSQWTKEAISNIVKNCMEHTPQGGSISIIGKENALYTQILISDTGPGIPKEELPHIFERFYKGKESGKDSFGIGLNLARMIVTRQNGTLKAENNPQGGALFTIRFMKSTI